MLLDPGDEILPKRDAQFAAGFLQTGVRVAKEVRWVKLASNRASKTGVGSGWRWQAFWSAYRSQISADPLLVFALAFVERNRLMDQPLGMHPCTADVPGVKQLQKIDPAPQPHQTNDIGMVIPVLEALEITGKTITADALLTQRALADDLIDHNAHYLNFPGVGQAFVIERYTVIKKTGKTSTKTVYG
jgi:hypothetical protein